jgi:hypothetical protein
MHNIRVSEYYRNDGVYDMVLSIVLCNVCD